MLELRTTGHCGNCSFGPWMSDNNIDGGARWNDKIAKALEETDFGIVCVTRENQSSAWLNFEAGAVAKKVGQARVIPLLIDLPPADLKGPLPAFQWRLLNEKDLRLLVHDVNNAAEQQVTEKTLDRLFDATWHELGTALTPRSTALRQLRRRRRENLMTCWPRSWRPYGGSSATWTAR